MVERHRLARPLEGFYEDAPGLSLKAARSNQFLIDIELVDCACTAVGVPTLTERSGLPHFHCARRVSL